MSYKNVIDDNLSNGTPFYSIGFDRISYLYSKILSTSKTIKIYSKRMDMLLSDCDLYYDALLTFLRNGGVIYVLLSEQEGDSFSRSYKLLEHREKFSDRVKIVKGVGNVITSKSGNKLYGIVGDDKVISVYISDGQIYTKMDDSEYLEKYLNIYDKFFDDEYLKMHNRKQKIKTITDKIN